MNILIASTPRSGSTLLASLLTKPPDRVVFLEGSLLHTNGALPRLVRQLEPFGAPPLSSKSEVVEWTAKSVPFWGTKEVREQFIRDTVERYKPHKIVVLIRNPWHAAISLRERQLQLGRGRAYVGNASSFGSTAALLPSIAHWDNAFVMRYEDLVSEDPAWRNGLSWWLDVPLDGDPTALFEAELFTQQGHCRQIEVERHDGEVNASSIYRREQETCEDALLFADSVAQRCEALIELGQYKKPDALAPGSGPKVHP